MGSFEDFMIDKTVKDEQRMADLKSEVERLNQDLSKATRDAASLEAKLQREQYTGPTTNHVYAAIELAKERDSLIERLKARDNQINELLKQTAANRVLLERINELEHELKEAQAECSDLGEQRDAAITETSTVRMERNEAQAAAAVMRPILEESLKSLECQSPMLRGPMAARVSYALSTTAGTDFLARMAEAEWLVGNVPPVFYSSNEKWILRQRAFLKGEGVKA